MIQLISNLIFKFRSALIVLFLLLTAFLGYQASLLNIDAGFEKQLPLKHPYMKTFLEHQKEFGGANRVLVAVRAKNGDIFSPEFFKTLESVTNEVAALKGVNRGTLKSLFTPNVRFIEIVEGGFSGGSVISAEFRPTSEGLAQVRENILKAGIVGRLVANDFSAALVSAELVENDPATGEKLDYLLVAKLLEEQIRQKFSSEQIDIHIIGFAKAMGDVADGALGVILFFGIAILIAAVLVYLFINSWKLTVLPLICSLIAVVWNMGLLTVFGFGIDPMSILVPFLVFAIGVSHSVQMINAFASATREGKEATEAARDAFQRLMVPGVVALLSDTIGFLTIYLIEIRIIQELAITSSLGVIVLVATNLVLLPLLLSFVSLPQSYAERSKKSAAQYDKLWRVLSNFTNYWFCRVTIIICIPIAVWAFIQSQSLAIGDIDEGVPELHAESRYNQDSKFITTAFSISVDIINVIVESGKDACIEFEIMDMIDRFQWEISSIPGVQSTISLPQVAKLVNAGWNEGHLKWRVLPRNAQTMVQSVQTIDTGTGLLNGDCSVMPVMIFLEDHKAETIERVTAAVENFAKGNNEKGKYLFRLATGNAGVQAATNEVIESAQFEMLLYVYGAVILLCLLTFRSIRTTICIILPLALISLICYALMSLLGIGLKVSTLPVAALGVGIGVDYGIYIYSRLKENYHRGLSFRDTYFESLRAAGSAVMVTGFTLSLGVSTWVFSDLKFQADMGILLAFMFAGNMLAALLLLPAIAAFLAPAQRENCDQAETA